MRPLFLEFPHAAADGHPLDLDAGSEFLIGSSLLIAPSPSPEEVALYEVRLPPGIWYDYWTGEQLDRRTAAAGRKGEFLRINFTCAQQPDGGLALHIGAHEGSFTPWWHEVRVEMYGWTPKQQSNWKREGNRWVTVLPDRPEGSDQIFH